jgi:hypothetical protein
MAAVRTLPPADAVCVLRFVDWLCYSPLQRTVESLLSPRSASTGRILNTVAARLALAVRTICHQLTLFRRQQPARLRIFPIDRLISIWLCRLRPRAGIGQAAHRYPTAPSGLSACFGVGVRDPGGGHWIARTRKIIRQMSIWF